jgi:hypothetical protein
LKTARQQNFQHGWQWKRYAPTSWDTWTGTSSSSNWKSEQSNPSSSTWTGTSDSSNWTSSTWTGTSYSSNWTSEQQLHPWNTSGGTSINSKEQWNQWGSGFPLNCIFVKDRVIYISGFVPRAIIDIFQNLGSINSLVLNFLSIQLASHKY